MKTPETAAFDQAITALLDLGTPSVWSLIVTLMGDMAARSGTVISGGVLAEILAPMGIKPEARRVALHRLRKDGWIQSDKTGRTSSHRLTKTGLDQSRQAAQRIYRQQGLIEQHWHVLWAAPQTKLPAPSGAIELARGLYLGQGQAPDLPGYFVLQGEQPQVPEWLQEQLGPKELAQAYQALEQALARVQAALIESGPLSAVQIASLRTLIVHHWRRILLKHADLPLAFFPDNWRGEACRQQVMALLEQLGSAPVSHQA